MIKKALGLGALISVPGSLIQKELYASERNDFLLKPLSNQVTGNALRFPPVLSGNTMTASVTNQTVWPGQTTPLVTINNSYPGPTIIIQKGSTLNVNFTNNLTEDSVLHWHGILAPEIMDGHPKYPVHPGQTYNYTFPIVQRAGTYWYHPHADMLTASQAFKGLAGFFIVTDPDEASLNLPSGNFDIPLCIQDRRSVDIPQFNYNPNADDKMYGMLGDIPLINGTPDAYFQVSKTLYRFRLLNGSNARVYKIAFSDSRSFYIIGTDGGLKDAPVAATSFYLSPGERVEILFDFSPYTIGQSVTLKSLPFAGTGGTTYQQGTEMNLLRFDITSNTSSGGVVPAALTPITYYNNADVVRTRNFTLSHVTSGGMTGMHRINGLTFQMDRIDFEVPQNGLEKWQITNATGDFHPMHSHGILFQVYSRNGNTTLAPNDKGWKETVLVNPYEQVAVLVKFTQYKGLYLWHCHNLEHEDDGMMLNFKVVDPIGINEQTNGVPNDFRLHQNYPNPFNPSTKIKYDVPANGGNVEIKIFDNTGKELETLVNEILPAGKYETQWNAGNYSSGVYYCKLITANFTESIKMLLMK
ncbi:MAG: multicopper oxidase domain-containing protein [Bacteroidetes bacterium]|nr:multicopper oxidase domain-containing protein [Bacteroidota bacterium]